MVNLKYSNLQNLFRRSHAIRQQNKCLTETQKRKTPRNYTNKGAIPHWILSQHYIADVAKACQDMSNSSQSTRKKKDMNFTRLCKDYEAVESMKATVLRLKNPFTDISDDLVHIASG